MRLSQACWQTYKEVPKEAEIPSHRLMLRAGLIQKSGSGLYQYLPFALRVIQKIENIIREELNKIGSQEILMSMVTPGELWKESGRWSEMENLMVQFVDRGGKDLCLSPTNEETVTDIFRKIVKSYKQLPVSLYQVNTKFRDEIRPRFGLMRGREFIMKDAYTFHQDKECLDLVYDKFYGAYESLFKRMGLDFCVVQADAGAMGTSDSKTHEFQVLAQTGEDDIVAAVDGSYAANVERAETRRNDLKFLPATEIEQVETLNMSTIKDVCDFLKVPQHQSLKSLVYTAVFKEEEKNYLIMLLGDDELNEVKLKNFLGAKHLTIANAKTLSNLSLVKGYIGAHKLEANLEIIFDQAVELNASYITGANKDNYHLKGFVPERDSVSSFKQTDLRLTQVSDVTKDGINIEIKKGIEVGHIFQLGDKYTKSMGVQTLGKDNKKFSPLMGCYGIGVTRTMAASIEQNHDENGIIWPMPIAPYQVYFAVIGKSQETKDLANELYESFLSQGVEILFDDRGMGPGGMFKDAELLGIPIRLTLGERDYKENGKLEIKLRKDGATTHVSKDEVNEAVQNLIAQEMKV